MYKIIYEIISKFLYHFFYHFCEKLVFFDGFRVENHVESIPWTLLIYSNLLIDSYIGNYIRIFKIFKCFFSKFLKKCTKILKKHPKDVWMIPETCPDDPRNMPKWSPKHVQMIPETCPNDPQNMSKLGLNMV